MPDCPFSDDELGSPKSRKDVITPINHIFRKVNRSACHGLFRNVFSVNSKYKRSNFCILKFLNFRIFVQHLVNQLKLKNCARPVSGSAVATVSRRQPALVVNVRLMINHLLSNKLYKVYYKLLVSNFLINFLNFSGPSGFYWDDAAFQCHDVNECELHGRCQQKCVNYLGGYECQCLDGYKSVGNGKCSPEKESIVAFVYEDRIKYTKFKVLQRKKFYFFRNSLHSL